MSIKYYMLILFIFNKILCKNDKYYIFILYIILSLYKEFYIQKLTAFKLFLGIHDIYFDLNRYGTMYKYN